MKAETIAFLETVLSAYPGQARWVAWDEQTMTGSIALYVAVLSVIPDERIRAAVETWCRRVERGTDGALKTKYRPTPDVLLAIDEELTFPGRLTAGAAWAECVELRRRYGRYGQQDPEDPNWRTLGPPPFSCEQVALTIKYLGGWNVFCDVETDEVGVLRAHFASRFSEAGITLRERAQQSQSMISPGRIVALRAGSQYE